MIRVVADRIEVDGAMTLPAATALLAEGSALLGRDRAVVDLAAVTDVDSSGLAVLFGWQRTARQQGRSLHIVNLPANLVSLAEVYGVTDLLPSA